MKSTKWNSCREETTLYHFPGQEHRALARLDFFEKEFILPEINFITMKPEGNNPSTHPTAVGSRDRGYQTSGIGYVLLKCVQESDKNEMPWRKLLFVQAHEWIKKEMATRGSRLGNDT